MCPGKTSQQCSVATEEQEEREQAEDEEAFHHHLQLRGLPYDTVMHREDTNLSADSVFSVAPGEGGQFQSSLMKALK